MQMNGDLLPAAERVQWIDSVDQRGAHSSDTVATRSHEVIKRWATERGAEPATGVGTVDVEDGGTEIRFNFPGFSRLRPLSWDEWFSIFDRHGFAFVFEERLPDGQQSFRFRIVPAVDLARSGILGRS
jgi:hypothetical protein